MRGSSLIGAMTDVIINVAQNMQMGMNGNGDTAKIAARDDINITVGDNMTMWSASKIDGADIINIDVIYTMYIVY